MLRSAVSTRFFVSDIKKHAIVLCMLMVCLVSFNASAGILARYSFDVNAADESGNGNHGGLQNGAVAGVSDAERGLVLDLTAGTDARVYLIGTNSTSNWLQDALVSQATVMFWAKVDGFGSVAWKPCLFDKYSCSLFRPNTLEYFRWSVETDAGFATANGLNTADNAWHHYAVTIDNTAGFIKLFIDGVEVSSGAIPGTLTTSTYPGILGSSVSSGGSINGYMDDAIIFDQALDAGAIQSYRHLELLTYYDYPLDKPIELAQGESFTYKYVMKGAPTCDVFVGIIPDTNGSRIDLGEGAGVSKVLTFTPDNWNIPQEVTLTAVTESPYPGDMIVTVMQTVTSAVTPEAESLPDLPPITVICDLPGDTDGNCSVDLEDFSTIVDYWLGCNDPTNPNCASTTAPLAEKEPALAVFYKATVRNNGSTTQNVHFALQPEGMSTGAGVLDENGRLLSSEMPGLFQAVAKVDGATPNDGMWTVSLAPGQETTYQMVMPYTPQSRAVVDYAANLDFEQKHAEVRDYWEQRFADVMQINLPEQQLNDDYKAGLAHILLRVYPGRYQAPTGIPDYEYEPTAEDYGVWNGMYCPLASESIPIIRFLDVSGFSPDFVEACLQYYYNRQRDDGRLQVFFYDIETPWVLWGTAEHYQRTQNTEWAKKLTPQIIEACDWIINKRRESYAEPEGSYGRGLFAGYTADDAPLDGGRNFMFNGYMYMGLKAAGELLLAIDNPEGDRISADAALYKQDILATLEKAIELAPRIQLGDGFWYPAIPPQHNIRGLANWIGYFSHGAYYLHDSELGPHHMVYGGVLGPEDQPVDFMLNVLSGVVFKETGIAESQPAYSRHPYALLQRGDVKNFLRAFYMLRYFSSDRDIGTWWEHKGGTGSPHKTHEEAWWLHQLRNMLVLESGGDIKLCAGIPRRWLESGKQIAVEKASTRYGQLSITVESLPPNADSMTATIRMESLAGQLLSEEQYFILRVPHPDHRLMTQVTLNGNNWMDFDASNETIRFPLENGEIVLQIEF